MVYVNICFFNVWYYLHVVKFGSMICLKSNIWLTHFLSFLKILENLKMKKNILIFSEGIKKITLGRNGLITYHQLIFCFHDAFNPLRNCGRIACHILLGTILQHHHAFKILPTFVDFRSKHQWYLKALTMQWGNWVCMERLNTFTIWDIKICLILGLISCLDCNCARHIPKSGLQIPILLTKKTKNKLVICN